MIHEVLRVGPLGCNCSILGDETSREAIVVDPGDEIDRILAVLAKHQLTVQRIVVTHAHFDHIAGAARLKQITGAPVLYNRNDVPLLKAMDEQAAWLGMAPAEVAPPDDSLEDGRTLSILGLTGTVLLTPGHTQGSLCLHLPDHNLLLAGDTLFAGSVGRTDLPGGNARQLIHSVREKLLPLVDSTVVLPGHGPATTIGQERATNPFLQ